MTTTTTPFKIIQESSFRSCVFNISVATNQLGQLLLFSKNLADLCKIFLDHCGFQFGPELQHAEGRKGLETRKLQFQRLCGDGHPCRHPVKTVAKQLRSDCFPSTNATKLVPNPEGCFCLQPKDGLSNMQPTSANISMVINCTITSKSTLMHYTC